tara:strand:+ start:1385 stop:1591 length:207 start_codon:yes stop_codon:yes gene_type:complete
MKEKKVTIKARHISSKQWSVFLLELNLIKKAWKKCGVDIDMTTPQLQRVLAWGTRKHDDPHELPYKEK